ncbi:30s ribosomal protein s1, chloroplastic [Heracleum sosnowskyi]|uniref:30s ribosomal protein s1, chloroplastic n=1 Tax=Heracleum sosnowskyi TaxID=360622 RepID=A0AAD8HR95_9APIA|nr:30s ribosomal protein s1, chloroplastic [Heracleum sosnowskyi]
MQVLLHPCNSFTFLIPPLPLHNFIIYNLATPTFSLPSFSSPKTSNSRTGFCQSLYFVTKYAISRPTHVSFCSKGEILEDFTTTHLSKYLNFDRNGVVEELELQNKPSPMPVIDEVVVEVEEEPKKLDRDEVLEPFLRFFKPRDTGEKVSDLDELEVSSEESESDEVEEEGDVVGFECYDPKPGDFVVGVVVSGNENKIDVNIGADVLGIMLKKDVLPLFDKELDYLLCDIEKDADDFMVKGRMGIVKNEDLGSGEIVGPGRPVVEPGTLLFAEVLGRTLSGKPLISTRRYFRRLAWHRVRQIKQFNEPIEVKITEWNSNGLLTRIEGLRAFLPKAELVNRTSTFTELKENVGRCIHVQVTRINESTNDLVLSEKEAWSLLHLKEGTLLDGTVKKIFPYGAQIRIGDSNRSGLLHISNITRERVSSVGDLLAVDEKVKVLVIKSMFPGKISLSTAELESEAGLFVSNKERVFSEAEMMAKKYRQKLPKVSTARELEETFPDDTLPYEDEEKLFSNWTWFEFQRDDKSSDSTQES